MGVLGLKSLLENNPLLFRTHRLHDCQLVIDGNNLFHKLYAEFHLDFTTGGDYDEYYTRTTEFFNRLKQCHVVPYVVLDGSHPKGAYAVSKAYQRCIQAFNKAKAVSQGEAYHGTLPLFVPRVFEDVLRDLNVAFVYCDYDADGQVTALANKLGCSVLSDDSDFYVYDLKAGFIPYDKVDFDGIKQGKCKAKGTKYRYFMARIFFQEDFLNGFGEGFQLNRTTFRLFATLCGRDIIQQLNIESLRQLAEQRNIESQSKLNCKLSLADKRQHDMIDLLYGLRFLTRSEAVDAAVSHLDSRERTELTETLHELILSYSPELRLSFDLLGLEADVVGEMSNVTTTLPSFTGEPLPSWFVRRCRSGEIRPSLLQAATVRWISLSPGVEQFAAESVQNASLQLRRAMYSILLSSSLPKALGGPKDSVMEIGRSGSQIKKQYVFAFGKLPNGVVVPPLDSLPSLNLEVKRDFLFNVFLGRGSTAATALRKDVPDEWQLFTWTVVHWLHYTRQDRKPFVPNEQEFLHLDCLLITAIYYNTLQSHIKVKRAILQEGHENNSDLRKTFTIVLAATETSRRRRCAKKLSIFRKSREFNRSNLPDLDVIHAFGQFQSCFTVSDRFNRLFDCPVPDVRVLHFLSFPFLYNVCCHMRDHWFERDRLLDKWLGPLKTPTGLNPIHAFFRDLRGLIVSTVVGMLEHRGKQLKSQA